MFCKILTNLFKTSLKIHYRLFLLFYIICYYYFIHCLNGFYSFLYLVNKHEYVGILTRYIKKNY